MNSGPRIVVIGANGQLGRAIRHAMPEGAQVRYLTRGDVDLVDLASLGSRVEALAPEIVVNCAAYTAVDAAESDAVTARAVNALAPGEIAKACSRAGARMLHISTDYVFDGENNVRYLPSDTPRPLSVYGATKREGEDRVLTALATDAAVVRVGWLHSPFGRCFPETVIERLIAGRPLRVVADQIGAPTQATRVARLAIQMVIEGCVGGIYHYTDAGVASWYDVAVACGNELARCTNQSADGYEIVPITTAELSQRARRPVIALLNSERLLTELRVPPVHWSVGLAATVHAIAHRRDCGE